MMDLGRMALFCVLSGVLGCNAITGIEAYQVGPAPLATLATEPPRDAPEAGPDNGADIGSIPDTIDSAEDASGETEGDTAPEIAPDADAPDAPDACPLHDNGLGQSYSICDPVGTHSRSTAEAARAAWPEVGTDAATTCGAAECVYRKTATSCAVWSYAGVGAGHVKLTASCSGSVTACCLCPSESDFSWN